MKHENGNCSSQFCAELIITQNSERGEHEIRQNHAEHENGNCSSQNRAEHEIRQNRAEHKNGNCSSQNLI